MNPEHDTQVTEKQLTSKQIMLDKAAKMSKAFFLKVLTLAAEAMVIIAIGISIGFFYGGVSVAGDCKTFGLAKAGNVYIHCKVLSANEPSKE